VAARDVRRDVLRRDDEHDRAEQLAHPAPQQYRVVHLRRQRFVIGYGVNTRATGAHGGRERARLALRRSARGQEQHRRAALEESARTVGEIRARVRLGPDTRELLDLQRCLKRRGVAVAATENDERAGRSDLARDARPVRLALDRLTHGVRQLREIEGPTRRRAREHRERDTRGRVRLRRRDRALRSAAELEDMLGCTAQRR
jgi:hypothetical protein